MKQHAIVISYSAWVVTLLAFMGSLYFSEVRHVTPCLLCWYQRILLYPLVLLIPIGLLRKDHSYFLTVLPFSVLGIVVSAYHYLLQTVLPHGMGICSNLVPCNVVEIEWLGFVTIPLLSLAAFIIITALMIVMWRARK